MANAFSVDSWNVEHVRNDAARLTRVVDLMSELDAAVFAFFEVEGKEVFTELVGRMSEVTFHIIEGPQVKDIPVGVRKTLTAFIMRKIEFRSA